MFFLKKQGPVVQSKKETAKIYALQKLNQELSQDQFYHLVDEFFKDYFAIHHEFTLIELKQELKHKRIDKEIHAKIEEFIDHLNEEKYNAESKTIADKSQFKSIVETL